MGDGDSAGSGAYGARNLREPLLAARGGITAGPEPLVADYQSNFVPKRKSRGGMIVVGWVKFAPEAQLMFWAALVLFKL